MASDAEVRVELRLLTEKAKAEVKNFAKYMETGFSGKGGIGSGGGGGGGGGVKGADDAVDKHISKLQKLTITLKDVRNAFKDLWKKGTIDEGSLDTIKKTLLPGLDPLKFSKSFLQPGVSGNKSLASDPNEIMPPGIRATSISNWATLLAKGKLLPTPPVGTGGAGGGGSGVAGQVVIPTANTLAGLTHKAMNAPLSGLTQTFAKATAGLAALRVVFGVWSFAIRAALYPIEKLNSLINKMAEGARQVYAGSLQSGGLPIGFTSYRQTLAKIMGVAENEVFQYAKQIMWLNKQIAYSTSISAKHNLVLTESSWKMGVVKNDWKALMDSLAAAFAGPKNAISDWLHRIINTVTSNMQHVVTISERWGKAVAMSAFMKSHGMKAEIVGGAARWVNKSGQEDPELRKKFDKEWEASQKNKFPAPEASARRYQTSPWERMGLVLGAGMGDNPAQKTAYNTGKMLQELQKMNNPNSPLNPKPYKYTKPAGAASP